MYELDLRAGELHRDGLKLRLDGQPLQILALLLQRPNEVVTREQIRLDLWPAETYVDFEHSINAAVKRLRRVLHDSATTPRYIETLARRGYRFVYPVNRSEPAVAEHGDGVSDSYRPLTVAGPLKAIKIGEVARHFGISASLLRLYERQGLLIPLPYGSSRRYTEADYPWISTLLRLVREDGLNLEGIRRLLALLPCWQIRGCKHRQKRGCPFIKNALEPCWVNMQGCCSDGQTCYSCAVYRLAPECQNLKPLLACGYPELLE